jgi:hypothetical protein
LGRKGDTLPGIMAVKSTGWFVTAGIISVAALLGGCTSLAERHPASPVVWSDSSTNWMTDAGRHFIEPEIQSLLTKECGDFWGKKIDNQQVILTISPETKISRFENLINGYNVAISTANLPQDLEVYLKGYPHKEYGDYYNYVKTFVDTIILCPKYIDSGFECEGMTWSSNDKLLYPEGGRLIFFNTHFYYNSPSNLAAMFKLLCVTVHETAHKQWLYLVNTRKIPYIYTYNEAERYALLIEAELLEKILQQPMSKKEGDYLKFRHNDALQRIRTFNINLELPPENRELFPEK